MKPFALILAVAPGLVAPSLAAPDHANTSPRHAEPLHFARGATHLTVRGFLGASNARFYTLKIRAAQKLTIRAESRSKNPDAALVPLLFVTPPRGRYNGDKTAIYTSNSTRAGTYRIEVKANQMASTATSGPFLLRISAR